MWNNHSYVCFKDFPHLSLDDVIVLRNIGYHPTSVHMDHAQITRKKFYSPEHVGTSTYIDT